MSSANACYGLCPSGPPQEIIKYNHNHYEKNTGDKSAPGRDFWLTSWKGEVIWRAFAAIPAYVACEVGYALSAVRKVARFAISFFLFAGHVLTAGRFSSDKNWKERGVILLDTGSALLIAVVGIACPPLAYKLDDLAKNRMTTFASKVEQTESTEAAEST